MFAFRIFTVMMTSLEKTGAHLLEDIRNCWDRVLAPTYDVGRVFLEMVDKMEKQALQRSASKVHQVEKPSESNKDEDNEVDEEQPNKTSVLSGRSSLNS